MQITGLDHVQVAVPRGGEAAAREFSPARKAHPAFLVRDLDQVQAGLTAAGHECVRADGEIPGVHRFDTFDPFGNRVEFQQG